MLNQRRRHQGRPDARALSFSPVGGRPRQTPSPSSFCLVSKDSGGSSGRSCSYRSLSSVCRAASLRATWREDSVASESVSFFSPFLFFFRLFRSLFYCYERSKSIVERSRRETKGRRGLFFVFCFYNVVFWFFGLRRLCRGREASCERVIAHKKGKEGEGRGSVCPSLSPTRALSVGWGRTSFSRALA